MHPRRCAAAIAALFTLAGAVRPLAADPGGRLLPPGSPVDAGEPPAAPEPETSRRPVELGGAVLTSLPHCVGSGSTSCAGGLPAASLHALWRTAPTLAVGAFALAGQADAGLAAPGARTLELGLVARAYATSQGKLEPYFELGVGAAHYARTLADRLAAAEQRGAALALTARAGLDLHLTEQLRVGPCLSWSELLVSSVLLCQPGSGCRAAASGDPPAPQRFVQVGLALTLPLGPPM